MISASGSGVSKRHEGHRKNKASWFNRRIQEEQQWRWDEAYRNHIVRPGYKAPPRRKTSRTKIVNKSLAELGEINKGLRLKRLKTQAVIQPTGKKQQLDTLWNDSRPATASERLFDQAGARRAALRRTSTQGYLDDRARGSEGLAMSRSAQAKKTTQRLERRSPQANPFPWSL